MSVKILIIASGFAPYGFSENIVNSKLALAFLEENWRIDVISRKDDGLTYSTEWHDPWLPLRSITHQINYQRGNYFFRLADILFQTIKMGIPWEGIRWAGRAYHLAERLHRERKYDVVLSRSPGDIGHLPALILVKKYGVPWLANYNDPPFHLWPYPYQMPLSLYRMNTSRRFLYKVMTTADYITFPSERLCQHVSYTATQIHKEKLQIIPHIGLVNYCVSGNRCNQSLFSLCHAGNLSSERNPEALFAGLAIFQEQQKSNSFWEMKIIGPNTSALSELAQKYGIHKNIKATGALSYLASLREMSTSDVLVLVEAPCHEGIFLPSKIIDYTQLGKPILSLSPPMGTMADLIRETGAGILVDNKNPDEIANGISKLYCSWEKSRLHEDYGVSKLYGQFEPKRVVTKYRDLFTKIGIMKRYDNRKN